MEAIDITAMILAIALVVAFLAVLWPLPKERWSIRRWGFHHRKVK